MADQIWLLSNSRLSCPPPPATDKRGRQRVGPAGAHSSVSLDAAPATLPAATIGGGLEVRLRGSYEGRRKKRERRDGLGRLFTYFI
ncbi:hypothetical protein NL676_022170 [Syzygium grande]|nr:hypothetical protein NL676_022170 [Syzygium grande]